MRETIYRIALTVLLLLAALLVAKNIHSEKRMTLSVYPPFQMATPGHYAYERVRVVVEPSPSNRLVRLSWDSDGVSGSSDISLAGEHGPKTTTLMVAVTPGEYSFRAILYPAAIQVVAKVSVH